MAIKTKITELLDEHGVSYRLLPHSEPVYTVETAAAQRDVIKEEMVKSILLRETKEDRYVMACVKGDDRLKTQAVRKHLPGQWRRLTFASREEIQAVTGFVQGAVAPLGLPEEVPVFFDEAIAGCTKVNISSGHPMAGIELDPQDLIDLAQAKIAPIAKESHKP